MTIVEATRAMLYDKDMPKFLWAEEFNTIGYVQNRTPHRALGKITLESVFTGKKPEVSHFRIFGSFAYCHILEEKRKKLDQTAEKGYLMGYSENAKAYRIYLSRNRKIVVESQEEEQIHLPSTSGRTSRELRQILRDAKDFVGAPRNEKREHRQPNRYQALVAQFGEPSSFQEVVQHQVWDDAMLEEYSSIMVNDVSKVVPRPQDRSVASSRWIYKVKYVADGSVEKYKARFVTKGYAQKEGID
eukprot:PITA_25529